MEEKKPTDELYEYYIKNKILYNLESSNKECVYCKTLDPKLPIPVRINKLDELVIHKYGCSFVCIAKFLLQTSDILYHSSLSIIWSRLLFEVDIETLN